MYRVYFYFLASSIVFAVCSANEMSLLLTGVSICNIVIFYCLIQSEIARKQRQEHLSRFIQEYGDLISSSEQMAVIKGRLSCAELQERLTIRQIQKAPFKLTASEILVYHHCCFASHSPFVRCAVNPDGPCNTCGFFEQKK